MKERREYRLRSRIGRRAGRDLSIARNGRVDGRPDTPRIRGPDRFRIRRPPRRSLGSPVGTRPDLKWTAPHDLSLGRHLPRLVERESDDQNADRVLEAAEKGNRIGERNRHDKFQLSEQRFAPFKDALIAMAPPPTDKKKRKPATGLKNR